MNALRESIEQILADHCTPAHVRTAEDVGWAPSLWSILADAGMPWVSVSESAGGVGGSLSDAAEVLRAAGRFAAPVPLADTMLAGGLLANIDRAIRPGPATVAPGHPADALHLEQRGTAWHVSGTLHRVPWAQHCTYLLILAEYAGQPMILDVERTEISVIPGRNLGGDPRDLVQLECTLDGDRVRPAPHRAIADFRQRGALTRVALAVGALERVAERCVEYTLERQQFGQPIANFQAVRNHLVLISEHVACASMALDAALDAVLAGQPDEDPSAIAAAVATAKIVTGEAIGHVVPRAHQVHGAMGLTLEHPLPGLTKRLQAWRNEYGSDSYWRIQLGEEVALRQADGLWPFISNSEKAAG